MWVNFSFKKNAVVKIDFLGAWFFYLVNNVGDFGKPSFSFLLKQMTRDIRGKIHSRMKSY